MEDFQSKYSGEQVEAILDSVANGETGGGGGITVETDPVFSASPAASITEAKKTEWDGKQDKITDLETIRSGAAKGATALQSYTEKYTGTITGITMNGASKGTSGVVNLGTVITEHQDISGKADKSSLATVATSGSYNDLSNKPTIPSAVTESTVSGWGFTKNTGTYSKPSGGIPKTDLASAVQTSLGKADTALQSYTEQYKGTVTKVKINGSEKTPDANGLVDLGTISGGGSSSSGSKEVVWWDVSNGETVTSMRPNVVYWFIGIDNVIIDSFEEPTTEAASYDVFTAILELGTISNVSISLTLPDYVRWANGAIPEIVADVHQYELSISRISDGWDSTYRAVLTPFKQVE